MKLTPSLVALSLLCANAACGSSVETEPGDDTSSTASSSVAATTGAAVSTGAGPATTSTGSASTSNGGSDPGTGGSGEGGGISTGEGGSDVGSGAAGGGIPGTGGGSGAGGAEPFLCGEVECAPDEQCCGSQQGVSCIDANDPCQGPVLTCQSATNCTGDDICCLQGDLQNAESVCTDVCEPTQAGPLQLCETADECVEDVPCMEIFGGFKVCTDGFP